MASVRDGLTSRPLIVEMGATSLEPSSVCPIRETPKGMGATGVIPALDMLVLGGERR